MRPISAPGSPIIGQDPAGSLAILAEYIGRVLYLTNRVAERALIRFYLMPLSSKFIEHEAAEAERESSGAKRKFGSPSGSSKHPKTFFPAKIRGATDVLIQITRSLSTGAVHLVFPKQAEDLRELIKQHLKVDEMRACHWHPKAGVWSNMTYDSIPTKPVLTAHPHDFIRAAIELFDSSELVSSWSILGPDGISKLAIDQALELDFTLKATEPKVEKVQVMATMDDIQSDLRVLHRLTCLFAKRAGITQEEIDKAEDSDAE